ncbi:hypothetical protein PCH70_08030 [Pseudomonas cichorii JBC1]|nr:hypothetical protein PCH70_08030 [Pseudomonas cichorii JBC1]
MSRCFAKACFAPIHQRVGGGRPIFVRRGHEVNCRCYPFHHRLQMCSNG